MAAIYVNGVKTSCMAIGGGGQDISEIVRLTSTEYDALQTKDDTKLYQIGTSAASELITKSFQGNKRILRKQDISDYEFWYEDLYFPYKYNSSDYILPFGFGIETQENYQKNWQLEFKVTIPTGTDPNSSEFPVFGTVDSSGRYLEFYVSRNGTGFKIFSNDYSDSSVGNLSGTDVVVKREGNVLTISSDGVTTATLTWNGSSYDDSALMYIGRYKRSNLYLMSGFIEYIGFKWLPTT